MPNRSNKYTHLSNLSIGENIYGGKLRIPGSNNQGVVIGPKGTATYGFHDILGQIETRGVGATDPTWTAINSSNFSAYAFALNDECWINYHIPHDYVIGSDIFIHTHWMPSGTNTSSVKWEFEYMYADGHNQEAFNTTGTIIYAEESPPGTALQHMVTESAAIDGSILSIEPDGILALHATRVTNGGTDNTDTIFVFKLDIHYQSTGIPTANRAPDFYAF